MANVKIVFDPESKTHRQTDRQIDRQRGQKQDAPKISFQGHKKQGITMGFLKQTSEYKYSEARPGAREE